MLKRQMLLLNSICGEVKCNHSRSKPTNTEERMRPTLPKPPTDKLKLIKWRPTEEPELLRISKLTELNSRPPEKTTKEWPSRWRCSSNNSVPNHKSLKTPEPDTKKPTKCWQCGKKNGTLSLGRRVRWMPLTSRKNQEDSETKPTKQLKMKRDHCKKPLRQLIKLSKTIWMPLKLNSNSLTRDKLRLMPTKLKSMPMLIMLTGPKVMPNKQKLINGLPRETPL